MSAKSTAPDKPDNAAQGIAQVKKALGGNMQDAGEQRQRKASNEHEANYDKQSFHIIPFTNGVTP